MGIRRAQPPGDYACVKTTKPEAAAATARTPGRPHQPGRTSPPPADPGMIPLTVPETGRLFAHPPPPGAATHWLAWRRRHQALSAWYHQRTRLTRDIEISPAR